MSGPNAVEARGLSFTYAGGNVTVGPVDWTVAPGSFQVIAGATGCGKTTLLRCLKPAVQPAGTRTGTLQVFGRDLSELDAREQASTVGYVAQNPETQVVCDTVWHDMAFGLENLGCDADTMHRRVAEVAHFFGMESWFDASTAELSGGQKQIVALAGVMTLRPQLLVLDEPTSMLDPVAEKTFLHALFRLNRELGTTVVMATHSIEAVIDYATDALVFADGGLRPYTRVDDEGPMPNPRSRRHPDSGSCAPDVVTLKDAAVRYAHGTPWVLRGMDLHVARGSIHAIVGGNGCGKSTLLAAMAGTMKPERGSVRNSLQSDQALLPQDARALFECDTVAEELNAWMAGGRYTADDAEKAARRFGLESRIDNDPLDLSGGQQQLLACAKLALVAPRLWLLDEPTKGLDAAAKMAVAETLNAAVEGGATVVLATHDLSFVASVADTVTMLFDGAATCTEDVDTFFERNLFYRAPDDAFARLWRRR